MTLDDVVREGKQEALLDSIVKKFVVERDQTFNPIRAYFDAAGIVRVDAANNLVSADPMITASYIDSHNWPSVEKAEFISERYKIEADDLINAVVAVRDEAIGAITDPLALYKMVMMRKPVSPDGLGTAHGKAYDAAELLRDRSKIDEKIGDYVTQNVDRLKAANTNKHAIAAVEFAFKRNPGLARNSIIGAANSAREGFKQTVTGDILGTHNYVRSLYDGLDDDGKKLLALEIGQTVTAIRTAPVPLPRAP